MKLFEPLTIKSMVVKNRIVMPAMQLVLGLRNRRARAYYLERARGGAGTMIMSATSVDLFIDDRAWGRPDGVAKFIESMKSFTEEIREAGAKIGIQLWHGNQLPAGSGMLNVTGGELIAPSAIDNMREMTVSERSRLGCFICPFKRSPRCLSAMELCGQAYCKVIFSDFCRIGPV